MRIPAINPIGGLRWTPYALAIADCYDIVIPFFLTVNTGLTSTGQDVIKMTDPYQFDTLLMGAHLNIGSSATDSDNGQQTFLNVTDSATGLTWVVPDWPDVAPATAFGGVATQVNPLLALPESYFLPAFTQLKHEWKSFSLATSGGSITWVGVQLIKPREGKRPEQVTMPDGRQIKIGSRLPWLSCLGLGTQGSTSNQPSYTLIDKAEYVGYTPAMSCDVEIHSIHAQFFSKQGVSTSPDNVRVTISDRGQRRMWGLNKAPAPSVFGSYTQIFQALPFTDPYLLKAGSRLQINSINQTGADIEEPYIVVRGVQRCGY